MPTEIKVERSAERTLINNKDTSPVFDALDTALQAAEFNFPEALIALAEYMGVQLAHADVDNGDQYYVQFFSQALGGIYAQQYATVALLKLQTPAKKDLN